MDKTVEVRQLLISRYRGLESLKWNPHQRMNIVIGGGDCGKSTILEALGLLFHPGVNVSISESDFWKKKSEDGFSIEATICVSDSFEFATGNKIFWPWEWDGENAIVPREDVDENADTRSAVFKVIVSANSDYELSWQVIQPDGSREHFPVGLRRAIGLVGLTNDNQNNRDLRLVYGSALDRLIADKSLRSKIGQSVSQIPLKDSLNDAAKASLNVLDDLLKEKQLPSGLDLGVTTSNGISIGSLIGLLADRYEVKLPLTSWGAGTCRMTALQISSAVQNGARITTIDEIERGLETYRLRQLIISLLDLDEQIFITTHSPVAVSCSDGAQLWYLDAGGNIGSLDRLKTETQQKRDPETFLSRVSVIVEGETEVGFVKEVLTQLFDGNPLNAGVRVALGQGDDQLLDLLEELNTAGIKFAGFADNDGKKPERWSRLRNDMGDLMFQWPQGCIESNILSLIPEDYIELLFKDQDGDWDGHRLRTIATRLGITRKSFVELNKAANEQGKNLLVVIIAAATGDHSEVEDRSEKKAWHKHAQSWFKKGDGSGGQELLHNLIRSGMWENVEETLRPFFNGVLSLSGKPKVEKIVYE